MVKSTHRQRSNRDRVKPFHILSLWTFPMNASMYFSMLSYNLVVVVGFFGRGGTNLDFKELAVSRSQIPTQLYIHLRVVKSASLALNACATISRLSSQVGQRGSTDDILNLPRAK
jgi:hypothetical protein